MGKRRRLFRRHSTITTYGDRATHRSGRPVSFESRFVAAITQLHFDTSRMAAKSRHLKAGRVSASDSPSSSSCIVVSLPHIVVADLRQGALPCVGLTNVALHAPSNTRFELMAETWLASLAVSVSSLRSENLFVRSAASDAVLSAIELCSEWTLRGEKTPDDALARELGAMGLL